MTYNLNQTDEKWLWTNTQRDNLVHTMRYSLLQCASTPVTSNQPPELLCSYSWREGSAPTYWIPGRAPEWQDLRLPIALDPDCGMYIRDLNAARSPEYTFRPIFDAVEVMNPDFRFDEVDVVVNRNSLRKLLNFCKESNQAPFRMNLALVHDTLVIERSERTITEVVQPDQGLYSYRFGEVFTEKPEYSEDSVSHHRVLRYSIGDLRCVVRSQTDACYMSPGSPVAEEEQSYKGGSMLARMGDLITAPAWLMRRDHQIMPQYRAAELKTCEQDVKPIDFHLPQLWFGRTPWLIMGLHFLGVFHSVEVTHAKPMFATWEQRNQVALRKLVTVLRELREAVRKNGGKSCVAIYDGTGLVEERSLKVFGTTAERRPLPAVMIDRFWMASKSHSANKAETAKMAQGQEFMGKA